jgi:hypothetical protein
MIQIIDQKQLTFGSVPVSDEDLVIGCGRAERTVLIGDQDVFGVFVILGIHKLYGIAIVL